MLKFYYSGAPNPTKVALFLEEAGLPYDAIPVDTRKGEQHKPEFSTINPNAKLPAIVDGDVTVFDSQRDPALSRREDRQIPAGQDRQGARRVAVVDVLRVVRRRPLCRPVGAFPQLRAGETSLRHQPLRLRGAAPFRHLDARLAKHKYMLGDTYTIVDMNVWGWSRLLPDVLGEGAWDKLRTSSADRRDQRPAGGAKAPSGSRTATSSRPRWTTKRSRDVPASRSRRRRNFGALLEMPGQKKRRGLLGPRRSRSARRKPLTGTASSR